MPRLPDYPSLRIGILLLLLLCNYAAAQSALFWMDRNLVATHRGGDAHHALQTLFAGPTPRQVARGWSTSIPPATRLLAVRTRGDELVIVLSEPFLQTLGQGQLEPALEQIIKTGLRSANAEGLGVGSVRIRIAFADGSEQDLHDLLPRPTPPQPVPLALRTSYPGALDGKRIALSPGHGYYWHTSLGWTTQRGLIDGLIEDIHTAEIVNRFLIPMLENCGATAFTCREHGEIDQQALADNDQGAPGYSETGGWSTSLSAGYQGGTYRFAGTSATSSATASWNLPVTQDGMYAAYAWFRASSNRAPDALYHIHHSGGVSSVRVDQTADDRTWVWLGDYWFAQGTGATIVLDNESSVAGRVVIADAVRLGGGVGSIARGGSTSGKPRWQECSRYWAEFAGAPASVYNSVASGQDNSDDVTCRPRYAEWRGADAFVSIHTNAGGGAGTSSYIYNGGATAGSATLQSLIHNQLINDFRAEWSPSWIDRGLQSANFGEVRLLSTMPGTLLELAFHDTPGSSDIAAIHHPRWRYLAARAIARGVLRYFAPTAPFPPEPPTALRVVQDGNRGLLVAWDASPGATGYTVEWSPDGKGFVPVAEVTGALSWSSGPLPADSIRSFRVRANNSSGCSMPTEVLTAGTDHTKAAQLLFVQGFDRLSRTVKSPDNTRDYLGLHGAALRRDQSFSSGFDAASNEAISLGRVNLPFYRAVVWALGEESTADETFSSLEQSIVTAYLSIGGNLMLSGAEIAWDLDAQGSASDRAFLASALGADYVADDAGTYFLQAGVPGSIFDGLPAGRFDDGTFHSYDVDWPDVIAPADSQSTVCLRYANGLTAGLQRQTANGRVVFLGLPLETVTDEGLRADLLQRAVQFLLDPLPLSGPTTSPIGQRLDLELDAPTEANQPYLVLAGDATAPGIPLPGGGLLPLRPGFLVEASLNPGNPFFGNFLGSLDSQGRANPFVDVPFLPELAGLTFYFSGISMQSNPPAERQVWNWLRVVLTN
ncbi:MAG: N-acetylmuramoyl-L-alanine amidase [Planctomycetota bacterium]|nr:N-acetylmuramoyl-L-alanine amidase [Planctomycetota bacterium]